VFLRWFDWPSDSIGLPHQHILHAAVTCACNLRWAVADMLSQVNDPNGPLYYNGRYHMFFQNVEDSTTWTW
jgi:hypothetical protein